MGLIDYISRHPVGKPQPPAYWDEKFVVALIDDFIACLEFQDRASLNLSLSSNPYGMFNTQKLDRNENGFHSDSFETAKVLILISHKLNFSRLKTHSKFKYLQPKISSTCEYPPISKTKTLQNTIMNRQVSMSTSGMSLPPYTKKMP